MKRATSPTPLALAEEVLRKALVKVTEFKSEKKT
jgi:F420-0:gamma-glutamyl ligase-like protein